MLGSDDHVAVDNGFAAAAEADPIYGGNDGLAAAAAGQGGKASSGVGTLAVGLVDIVPFCRNAL